MIGGIFRPKSTIDFSLVDRALPSDAHDYPREYFPNMTNKEEDFKVELAETQFMKIMRNMLKMNNEDEVLGSIEFLEDESAIFRIGKFEATISKDELVEILK